MTLLRKLPFYIQVLCLALIFSAASAAERKKWETLSDCQYVAKELNDGDPSFTMAATKMSTDMQKIIESIRDGTRRRRGKRLFAQLR